MTLPVRPWRVGQLDENGGYDCITPGVDVLDALGKRIFTVDAKDFDWPRYVPEMHKIYQHEIERSNIRIQMMDVANSICVAMNRMPQNWGPWA